MANYVNKNAVTQVLEEIYIYISKEIAHVTRDITNIILSQLHQTLIHLTTNLVSSAAHDTIFIPYASIYTSLYRNSVEESKNDKPGTFPHHLFRLTHWLTHSVELNNIFNAYGQYLGHLHTSDIINNEINNSIAELMGELEGKVLSAFDAALKINNK